jgi:hypothetical protein
VDEKSNDWLGEEKVTILNPWKVMKTFPMAL